MTIRLEIIGKHLKLRLVETEDAQFILDLRNNENLNKYLSRTDSSLENQKKWIENYKIREAEKKEFYFIIEDNLKSPYGTIRIYNINEGKKEFEWGSWILKEDRPRNFSYFSIIESFNFAFEQLSLKKALIEVYKENLKANYLYKKIGAKLVKNDFEKNFYEYSFEGFSMFKIDYLKGVELMKKYRLINFNQLGDNRGHLVVAEGNKDIPFDIKRIFYIYGTKENVTRGQHANKKSKFVLINLAGNCKIKVDDGINQEVIVLDKAHQGIYLEEMVWKDMYDFSVDSILLVLSSEYYDGSEYVRDYEEFRKGFVR